MNWIPLHRALTGIRAASDVQYFRYRELEPAMRSAMPNGGGTVPALREAALRWRIAATKVGTGLEGQRALATMYLALGRSRAGRGRPRAAGPIQRRRSC